MKEKKYKENTDPTADASNLFRLHACMPVSSDGHLVAKYRAIREIGMIDKLAQSFHNACYSWTEFEHRDFHLINNATNVIITDTIRKSQLVRLHTTRNMEAYDAYSAKSMVASSDISIFTSYAGLNIHDIVLTDYTLIKRFKDSITDFYIFEYQSAQSWNLADPPISVVPCAPEDSFSDAFERSSWMSHEYWTGPDTYKKYPDSMMYTNNGNVICHEYHANAVFCPII